MMKGLRIVGILAMAFAIAHCGDSDVHVSTDEGVIPAPGTFTGTLSDGGSIRLEVGSIEAVAFDCDNERIQETFDPPREIDSDGTFNIKFSDGGRDFRIRGTFDDNNTVDGRIEDEDNQCDASYVAHRGNVLPTVTPARTPTGVRPTATPEETATPADGATFTPGGPTFTPGGGDPTTTPTPTSSLCGNGVVDSGEDCDTVGGAATSCQTVSNTSAAFTCSSTCKCACPTKVSFTGNASAPESILDTGWTGIAHRAPIISDGTATVTLSCPGGGTSRPCGTCTVSGPVANGAGQIPNQRCTNDTSIKCTSNAPCTGGGTCEFFFGSNLPLAAGGVTVCAVNQFNGAVSGTANVETGNAKTVANLTSRVYTGIAIDNPCARCIGDTILNDGPTTLGTCSGGTRNGSPCDGNGTVPGRPDFGTTSLDCPLAAGVLIATLPIDLSNATAQVTKTLSASNPLCRAGVAGERCLCDTCDNAASTPCGSNADCGGSGICGGRRCLPGSTTPGLPCTTTGLDPVCGGGICGRAGTATAPSACLDNTATPGLDCTQVGTSGEGACTQGPTDQNCTVASGHAQRSCTVIADCGGGAGSCVTANRNCFLTGGGLSTGTALGTGTLTAVGMADVPMADTSNPTLGAVFCVGPTGASAVNDVSGLPGPGRATIKGAAVGLP